MKKTLLSAFILFSITLFSQKIATVKNAVVQFEASVPIFEPVAAINNSVHSALNTRNGYISFEIVMKQFHFEKSLMEAHFNENYLETDRYSKATFKGIIENFDLKEINNLPKTYLIKGKLKIHGKTKAITTKVKLQYNQKGLLLVSKFDINTDDFDIVIPALVRNKISKTVAASIRSLFPVTPIKLDSITVHLKSNKN
ncbi:YceI family protein [Flavobacterium algicola]|uniref:YceI family protein n=1 Tax=Flavobacterium algicola TaxID=556529 RepID=UPI001EFD71E1|nr:YceI family protein [Flavobacterium algicola]MCG9792551.1 YceI family protein [Flavobacterium algicola]